MIRVVRLNTYLNIKEEHLSYYKRLGYELVGDKQDSNKEVENKTSTSSLNSKPKTTRKKKI